MWMLNEILMNLIENIHVTRSLFYPNPYFFKDQSQSDFILDDVSCILGCRRSSLNVLAVEKGVVIGRLKFSDQGCMVDCTEVGMGGRLIPSIDDVGNMETYALFVLLVEKHIVYMRLAEDRFYERFRCITITRKGTPDIATRMFLRKLKIELKLPVLALFDCDPHGLSILSTYVFGSRKLAHDSGNLDTPDIQWLGFRPSDVNRCALPDKCRVSMKNKEINITEALLKEEFVQRNQKWVEELKIMLDSKKKVELEALSFFKVKYLSGVYIPFMLEEKEWLCVYGNVDQICEY